MKLFNAACLAVCAAIVSQQAHAAGTLDRIKARGSVILAHRDASVPLSYLAEGRPVGYSVDICLRLAEVLAREAGLKAPARVEYLSVTSANRFDVIARGEADLECGSTTNTAERRQKVAFTIPHFIASSRLMVLSSNRAERIEELDGKTVASTVNTTNIRSVASEARMKGLNLKVVPVQDHAEGARQVQEGKVTAFAMDDVLLFGLRAASREPAALKVIGKPITIEPYAIAFERENPRLKQIVDAEMRRLIDTKQLHSIYTKWFMQPIPPKGINLQMPMSHLLSDSLKYPTDFVPN